MNLTFENFVKLAADYDLVALHDTLPSDLDTPVSAFLKIATGLNDFLLESVEGGAKWARFSFLGTRPKRVYRLTRDVMRITDDRGVVSEQPAGDDPLVFLASEVTGVRVYPDSQLPRFFGGAIGYLSYNMVRHFEDVTLRDRGLMDVPDLYFLITDSVIIFDNLKQEIRVVNCVRLDDNLRQNALKLRQLYDAACHSVDSLMSQLRGPQVPIQSALAKGVTRPTTQSLTREQFVAVVKKAQRYILEGDIFQVVPSLRFEVDAANVDPFTVYRHLRRINPSPYMYYFNLEGLSIAGASPEVLVRVEDGIMQVRPIAGTRMRGSDEAHDKALEAELMQDPKEAAEHVMLVDLGRNDVGRVCEPGSVKVDDFSVVERYSHVMHLVSHVRGRLAADKNVFDALRAAFPAGTLSGAPKIRAMEIIDELEPVARGVYGGAIGYMGYSGNADFAIAIRTAVFTGQKILVQAGAGIVHASVPELEYEECCHKAGAVLKAIDESRGEPDTQKKSSS